MTGLRESEGRPVMETGAAHQVGTVKTLVVDPAEQRVVAVRLAGVKGDADTLRWEDVHAFGADAVTFDGAQRLTKADSRLAQMSDKKHALLGKRVLTDAGNELGSIGDVYFDERDGSLTDLLLVGGADTTVGGSRLLGVGSYAVVVRR